jgi:hypothetical protein
MVCAGSPAAEIRHADSVHSDSALQEYLNGRLAFWRQHLKLQDWSISVLASGASDLRPGTLGNIHWDSERKTAVIRVLATADDPGKSTADAEADMEETVVHELVHLELALLPKTDASRPVEEFAVDRLAGALLSLERNSGQSQPLTVYSEPGMSPDSQ